MTFQEWLEENCYETRSYSGRGMYGKDCLAITVSSPMALWNLALILKEDLMEDEDLDFQEPSTPNWDAVGLGYVLYWPNVPFKE